MLRQKSAITLTTASNQEYTLYRALRIYERQFCPARDHIRSISLGYSQNDLISETLNCTTREKCFIQPWLTLRNWLRRGSMYVIIFKNVIKNHDRFWTYVMRLAVNTRMWFFRFWFGSANVVFVKSGEAELVSTRTSQAKGSWSPAFMDHECNCMIRY